MKVALTNLSSEWTELEWEEPVDRINVMLQENPYNSVSIAAPFRVKVMVSKIGNDINLKGDFSANLKYSCDRCCESSACNQKGNFSYVIMPIGEQPNSDADMVHDEMEELDYYEGDEIELSKYAYEELILSLPFKMLCKESCKGLCSICGVNMNVESCRCNSNKG